MKIAHDLSFGERLTAIEKIKDRIRMNFYWHGMQSDIISFCQSCAMCQKTVANACVPRNLFSIDMPHMNCC